MIPRWFFHIVMTLGCICIFGSSELVARNSGPTTSEFEAIKLEGEWSGSAIGQYLYLYEHEDRSVSTSYALGQIYQARGTRSLQHSPNFGLSAAVHFAFFMIHNPAPEPQSVVLENTFGAIDYFVLYEVHEQNLQEIMAVGDQSSFLGRSYNVRNINKELVLKPGLNTFLIRSWGDTCVQFPIKIWKSKDFLEHAYIESLALGILLGFQLVMVVYNFFLYIMIRHNVYLFYVIVVLSNVIYFFSNLNLGQQFFSMFFGWEVYPNGIQLGGVDCLIIFSFLFTRSYHKLDYKGQYKWIDRYLSVVISMCLLDIFVIQNISDRFSSFLVLINSLNAMFFLIVVSIVSYRAGNNSAKYFLLGWASYLAGSFDVVWVFFGFVEPSELSNWSQIVGGAMEVAFFSLALGNRYMEIQRSLYLSESTRAEYQQALGQELQTKFLLMRDLSHRINNPLNHISTHVDGLQKDLLQHESELMQLLRDSVDEKSNEAVKLLRDYESRLRGLRNSAISIQEATLKTSATVKELRTLSGIDGYHRELCELDQLLESCQCRITEIFGRSPHFILVRGSFYTKEKFYGNNVALLQSILSILVSLYKNEAVTDQIRVDFKPSQLLEHCLVFSGPKAAHFAYSQSITQALDLSRHLQKPYSIDVKIFEKENLLLVEFHIPKATCGLAA